jgi:peptide methionine sulfoxide reductase msrA/msrB
MNRLWVVLLIATVFAAGVILVQTTQPQAVPKDGERGNWKNLSSEAARVIEGCGTERAFSGKFLNHKEKGTYTCARCEAPLFPSGTKFDSGSGWPSFDDAIPGALKELKDPDGQRTEIRCARCDGHLGHVFRGERMTSKDTRHCVNSVSLGFEDGPRSEAFFAGGCFWGVEHLLEAVPGVLRADSGYMGGHVKAPRYKAVTGGRTGHAETVRITFDPSVVSYETLARLFFEIHDPTQVDRQGPDRGPQYRSAIFVTDSGQERTVYKLIGLLQKKGLKIATKVHAAEVFWPAEDYHQDYYKKTGKAPYCHSRVKRF